MDFEQIMGIIKPFLESLAGKYGWLTQVLVIMASLRVVFKPLMGLADALVIVIPGTKDNEFLEKIKKSKAYGIIVWIVDFFASVKLPKADKQ